RAGFPAGATLRLQLELETGLGRGGIAIEDTPAAVERITAEPGVELVGLWSHLGSAGDPPRSGAQAGRFDAIASLRTIDDTSDGLPARHFAASGGMLADAVPAYDAVRPGLSMYGVVPEGLAVAERHGGLAEALRPVLSLHARPVRVADLPSGS